MNQNDLTANSALRTRPHLQRRTWWLTPKPFDVVSTPLYLGVLAIYFYDLILSEEGRNCACGQSFEWWEIALMIGSTMALIAIDRLEYWYYGEETPARAAIILLAARIVLIEAVAQLDNFHFSPFLYLIPPFLACLYFNRMIGYWLAILAWVVYMVKHVVNYPESFNNPVEVQYMCVFTLGLVFAVAMARVVVTEKASRARSEQLLSELKTSHRKLKAYSEQVAELATTRERNRLARDIHDTLGHYLTVINVQLEKALAFRDKRAAEADQAVSDAKRMASEALHDVRRSVGALRATDDMPAFLPAMQDLVERVRSNQCIVLLHVEGSEEGFSGQSLIALYRAAQEGLTNVQKHADARNVYLALRFGPQEASLSLSDDGRGFNPAILQLLPPEREGRYGLQGIQERLECIGGSLHIESEPGRGTQLVVTVPREDLVQMGMYPFR